jgi:uncharacterized membrane protein YbhN (UPF0104 family)
MSFLALATYFIIYGRSWQVIMRDLNAPILFSQSIWMIATTQVGKYLPGKVWYIVGRVYVGKQAQIDGKKLTLSMVIETCLVYVTGGIVFSLTTLIAGNYSLTWLIISILLTIAAIIIIHPKILGSISNFLLRILKRPTINLTLTYRQLFQISLYFFGIWIAQIAGFYFLIQAIYPIPLRSLFNLSSAYSLAWISGSLAVFAPGGLGVREGMMALLLSSVLPAPLPIAISFISRVWITIFEAVVFFIGLAVQRRAAVKAKP